MAVSLYEIPLRRIDGSASRLADYRGKVLLVVNVASKCGLTSQYAGLEGLYQNRRDKGLEVLGFPANNLKKQEPGSDDEIRNFCSGARKDRACRRNEASTRYVLFGAPEAN